MGEIRIKDGFSGERSLILSAAVVRQAAADPVLCALYVTDIGFYPHAMHHYRRRVAPIGQYVLIYCVNVSHLTAMFKDSTGHSPLNYFNMMKVKKACELLETTDMKINQISSVVGIYDPLYFSRMFSKIIGVSPKKFREELRQ